MPENPHVFLLIKSADYCSNILNWQRLESRYRDVSLRSVKRVCTLSIPLIQKVRTLNFFFFIGLSVLLSEILTSIMSIILRGRVAGDYLITGAVVSLIVSAIIVYFAKQVSRLSFDNENLRKEIVNRGKLEEALQRSHNELEMKVREQTSRLSVSNERLRNLAVHLQSVREEERTKIAREIHDELGQMLIAQKMELSWFRDRYGDHKPILDKSGDMLEALGVIIRSVKRICTELRPSILDDFGLVDAMQWQANEFQARTQIECVFDYSPEDLELDKERNTALFRIFQEALTNVLKHAGATKVTAMLTKDDENIMLEIIDNGIGITDEELSKPQSFGLMGMRERVYPWGGKVEITGHQDKGTAVKVGIPVSGRH